MVKSEVYSWRVSRDVKSALEEAARAEGISVGRLLDRISKAWLKKDGERNRDDEAVQKRLHAAAEAFVGAFAGGDPQRAEEASERVRARLTARHES